MKTKKTTRILHEEHEVLSVRRHAYAPSQVIVLCEECGSAVPLVALEEAMVVAGVSALTLYRMAEAGLIHFRESPEGLLLVCLDSLIKFRMSLE
jgi:hypothetical protein